MSDDLLTSLLRDVSRSFYLTLRVLPAAVRPQIGVAYLLARTTDTVADTQIIPVESRLESLSDLRGRILGQSGKSLPFSQWQQGQRTLGPEQILLARAEEVLRLLETMEGDDRALVRRVLDIIISGQELDLKRFHGATAERIVALETEADLNDYTYRVAGCVGEFWTRMCRAHLIADASVDEQELIRKGIRFGQGLQMVNILRDIPQDLRNGRCYIPAELLTASGLTPESLLLPETEDRFRSVYSQLLDTAADHLRVGWEYTALLPRRQMRLRLACAWPLLIGARTLRRLRHENILDPANRVKVTRPEVYSIILRSIVLYGWASAWDGQFRGEI